MVDLLYFLTNLLFFDIPLLYCYYINLRSFIIFYLFLETYIFLLVFIYPVFSVSFSTVSKLFFGDVFEIFVTLRAILLPIKSPVASAVF